MSKNKLTVAIFTKDRSGYLHRQLKIFSEFSLDFKLMIFDGSTDTAHADKNRKLAKIFQASYIKEICLFKRFALLSDMLETPYVAYCSDDDVINSTYYHDAVDFLEKNSEYSLAAGLTACIAYNKKFRMYLEIEHLSNPYDISLGDFVEKICKRDQAYMTGCPPTFYAVRRSQTHHLLAQYVLLMKTYSGVERLEAILNLTEGGIKVIDSFMGYRDYSSEPHREAQRDDSVQYIPCEDVVILESVIEDRLLLRGEEWSYIAYAKKYAWPLPLRPNTGSYLERRGRIKRIINMIYNKFLNKNPLIKSINKTQNLLTTFVNY